MFLSNDITEVTAATFEHKTLELFRYQYTYNAVYKRYVDLLHVKPQAVKTLTDIPFLPVEIFKSAEVITGDSTYETIFTSSGTTGDVSKHYVKDTALYDTISRVAFEMFYGDITQYCFLALLPSYLERSGSSLVHMVQHFMDISKHPLNGFYLDDFKALTHAIQQCEQAQQPTVLIGVSFALLDYAENIKHQPLHYTTIMETGGMKGRRKEVTREELHDVLKNAFNIPAIHSEYGMTELLSQAYSTGNGLFATPPWMKVLIRDVNDPFAYLPMGRSGGINVIDMANVHSCAFIQLSDLGRVHDDGTFEVLGRYDNSDIRGCNLMVG